MDGGHGKSTQILQGESRHTKSIFKTHVTVATIFYYTLSFIITALKVKNLVYEWMEGGVFVRDQVGKGGRHRFCILNFGIQILEFTFCIC